MSVCFLKYLSVLNKYEKYANNSISKESEAYI